jgi:hypothetical protein
MWTRSRLQAGRDEATEEANAPGCNHVWRHACLDLAASFDRLDAITSRICKKCERACTDEYAFKVHPQLACDYFSEEKKD